MRGVGICEFIFRIFIYYKNIWNKFIFILICMKFHKIENIKNILFEKFIWLWLKQKNKVVIISSIIKLWCIVIIISGLPKSTWDIPRTSGAVFLEIPSRLIYSQRFSSWRSRRIKEGQLERNTNVNCQDRWHFWLGVDTDTVQMH